jgi:hypothetical protein
MLVGIMIRGGKPKFLVQEYIVALDAYNQGDRGTAAIQNIGRKHPATSKLMITTTTYINSNS